jgi:hypothetical protein
VKRLRLASALLVGLGLVLGAIFFVIGSSNRARDLGELAATLEATLKSEREAARVRAEALAALPMARAGIETDAATVADIQRSNSIFSPLQGETLELLQAGGHVLLRLPQPTGTLAHGSLSASEDGSALLVTASAVVKPLYGGARDGELRVQRRVALDGLRVRLAARDLRASLVGPFGTLLLSGEARGAPASQLEVPVGPELRLVAARDGGGGALLILSLLFVAAGIAAGVIARPRSSPVVELVALEPSQPIALEPSEPITLEPLSSLVPQRDEPPSETDLDLPIAGKYRVLQPIGGGRSSRVYLAQTTQQLGVPKVIALKLFAPEASLPPDAFLEAMQHVSRVKSPHLVRIYDFGIDQQRLYVAMEYVEGCSLDALLQEVAAEDGRVPLGLSLPIIVRVLQALEAAHGASVGGLAVPVLHRDLRASSILIGKGGSIKLGDFGVGRGPSDTVADDLRALSVILRQIAAGTRRRSLDAVIAKATSPEGYASAALLRADLEDVARALSEPPSGPVLVDWVERARRSHG